MKMFMGVVTLVVAILISAIAGYFSIVGLAALFAARALPVIVMGSALEVGKLVAATWLKLNWKVRSVSILHKGYLLLATVVLMVITSLGIFGFLSAGHLEQNAPLAGLSIQQQQFQVQLDQATASNKRIETRLTQIDANINAFLTGGAATKGLRASNSLKRERDQLQAQMDANNTQINALNTKLAPLKQQSTEVEAKLGPVKYLASAAGYDDPEVAVRLVILLIMIAFDPLAVILMLSAMATFSQISHQRQREDEADDAAYEAAIEPTLVPAMDPIDGGISATILPETKIEAETSQPVRAFEIGETIPFEVTASGHAIGPKLTPREIADKMAETPKPVVEPMLDDPIEIRNLLIDIMEQYPDIVNELITTAKEIEDGDYTTSAVTGGTAN